MNLRFDGWPWKTIGHLFYTMSSFVRHFKVINESKLELQSGNAQFRLKLVTFCPMWPWNRIPFLYFVKPYASFKSHQWFQTGVMVRKCSIQVKIGNFMYCVSFKSNVWPWKTIGHLFYTTSSSVHHFITICEFKLELQSGNTKFGSKSIIFFSCVTLKFDRWHWTAVGHFS